MAQTKRKRRTKHRGNAVGSIEARGRTGRKPTAQESRGRSAGRREIKPPSWKSAFAKAAFGAVLLFALVSLGVLGESGDTGQALVLCAFAMIAYTPVMYWTDRFIYNRKQRQEAARRS
jgi:hypothetical protein